MVAVSSKTFLKLSQDYSREVNFAQLSAVPTTVIGQTGRLLQATENVRQSWIDIQNRHSTWRWMRSSFSLQTTASDDSYAFTDATDDQTSATIDRFARWRFEDPEDPPKIFLTSSGVGTEIWLIWVPYDYFLRIYRRGTQVDSLPAHITIDPQNNIRLGPKPDGIYTLSGSYQRSPLDFTLDADVPDMPVQFHNLIWAEAIGLYGMNHVAQHIVAKHAKLASKRMRQLEIDQLPDLYTHAPMA